jgi:hypothetical protein
MITRRLPLFAAVATLLVQVHGIRPLVLQVRAFLERSAEVQLPTTDGGTRRVLNAHHGYAKGVR